MRTSLFLQSEVPDPYKLYEAMLVESPVYRDAANGLWAVYSYEACTSVLNNTAARIPSLDQDNKHGLNEYVLQIRDQLVRLSNGIQHEIARQTAMHLFERMKTTVIREILEELLSKEGNKSEIDWVNSICKKLPLMVVLRSFDFNDEDCRFISGRIGQLVKIMQPAATPDQAAAVNEISKAIYGITHRHLLAEGFHQSVIGTLSQKYNTGFEEVVSLCVSNLIGLFIQGYDAGRGILSNSLLNVISFPGYHTGKEYLQKSVIETLRFDPPVHNTRRSAADEIVLKNVTINKGENILIVMAAANRDPQKFSRPNTYDIDRINNEEHLTFGTGSHMCLAKSFSVNLATETLSCFLEWYKTVRLIKKEIEYEPVINVRLPKNIFISVS